VHGRLTCETFARALSRGLVRDCDLPGFSEFGKQLEALERIGNGEADTVVLEIDKDFAFTRLDAVNGGGQKYVICMAEKRSDGVFPLAGKAIEEFEALLEGFRW